MLSRKKKWISATLLLVLFIGMNGSAEETKEKNAKAAAISEAEKVHCNDKEEYSETKHQVIVNGQQINYTAVAGTLILKNESCQPKASIFYISYTKEDPSKNKRPVTFCFNGGPGSSSVWLHLGLLGPRRVFLNENGDALPPYHLVDNEFSLLDVTDLVFIDPISTGFSQAIPLEDEKKYHGVEEDIKMMAEFIQLYITRYQRWESPKFIVGESYGTTRAAGLAGYLHDKLFIYTNGLVLISTILNFQSIDFNAGNDLSYLLILPSYTATAWYHKKLHPLLQSNFLETMQKARDFVVKEYSLALFKGDLLSTSEKEYIANEVAAFTGLSAEYVERSNLRVEALHFAKELLRREKRTLGRFDTRFQGMDSNLVGEYFEYDPSLDMIIGAFTSTFNHYVQSDLQWKKETPYKVLVNVQPWDYGSNNQYLNVAETLRGVLTKNPFLRAFVANGYYDLATPFYATEYTFNHLGLDSTLLSHVTMKHYDAGHMMYIYRPSLIKLKQDLVEFYQQTLENQKHD